MSKPPWQPEWQWQDYGTLWGGGEPATGSAVDMSQPDHTALLRINPNNSHLEWRYWNHSTGWAGWTDISSGMAFNGKIGITNHYGETDVVAVKNGVLYFRKRTPAGAWTAWESKGFPPGGFNGPVAVSGAPGRIGIVGVASGTVYFKKYNGAWDATWTALPVPGGLVYGGSIAIATRSNGLYHVVAFNTSTAVVWITCSTNGTTWPNWSWLGGAIDDSLAIDNDAATGCGGSGSYPGIQVVGFSALHTMLRCWEPYCQLAAWEDLGAACQGPVAVSNPISPYSNPPNLRWVDVLTRTANDVMRRYRVY